jgi:prevent-host-death family protein
MIVRDMKDELSEVLADAQEEEVLVTKHGKPVALLIGVEGMDLEDVYWGTNREALGTIAESRAAGRKLTSHDEVLRRYGLKKPRR